MVKLKRNDDGTLKWFRIPDTGKDDGILAVTMTALTANLDVAITYDPALTSGCGTEPRILYISLNAAKPIGEWRQASRHGLLYPEIQLLSEEQII